MELTVRVQSRDEALKAIYGAKKSGAKKIVLLVPASDPAGAAEVVREALTETTFITVEVRVVKSV